MRKQPSQHRSRALVESLIEATARTIAEDGLEAATTARIAKRAGVSVGSLYQYFDDKQALYDALLEAMSRQLEALIDEQMQQIESQPLNSFVTNLLEAVWVFLEADNGRYLQVVRNWSQLSTTPLMAAIEQKMVSSISLYLAVHPPQKPLTNISAKLYFIINGAIFTQLRYISDPPAGINRDQLLLAIAEQVQLTLVGN